MTGIQPSPEFARKGLAEFAVNPGTKCSHDCFYCSTGTLVRTHHSFVDAGESPFEFGYGIVDPETPARVAVDASKRSKRGMVQLSTTVDSWSPECQQFELGRRCLEAILSQPDWTVRILTKNAAVQNDFDLIQKHRERVLVGISLTGVPANESIVSVVEPHASPITQRIAALREANRLGLRTYGMLCPLLPGVSDDRESVCELVQTCLDFGAEQIFVEPVNPRGSGLRLTQEALTVAGYLKQAQAVGTIRTRVQWSHYCANLIATVQQVMEEKSVLPKLRFLLYPNNLTAEDRCQISQRDTGVCWLGK
jgi:DNA repair photolyase